VTGVQTCALPISIPEFQYLSAAIVFITTILGAGSPIFVTAPKWTARLESLSGGVFLGAGLAHLLADATEELEGIKYPLAPAVAASVFVIFTVIELFSYSEHDADVLGGDCHDHRHQPTNSPLVSPDVDHDTAQTAKPRIVTFGTNMSGIDTATVSLYVIMSVHSAIEGLALGVLDNWSDTIAILCAIVAHKPVEAFALGLIVLKKAPMAIGFALLMGLYSLFSPAGVIAGIQLRNSGSALVIGLIEAFSAGAFLFVGCHQWSEMFEKKHTWATKEKLWHIGVFLGGVIWMLLIALIETVASR
jgi:zinc transporter 1/2/3